MVTEVIATLVEVGDEAAEESHRHSESQQLPQDGLFLECVRNVAKDFPEVALDDMLIDASTAHLVRAPERFVVDLAIS